jgi:hypothetical protein
LSRSISTPSTDKKGKDGEGRKEERRDKEKEGN